MLPPLVISGAASRASATNEYALTSCATRKASRVVLTKSPSNASRGAYARECSIKSTRSVWLANVFEKCFDLIVARHIAGKQRSLFSELAGQFLDIFLQPFALIIENQARTRRGPSFCDRPGDAAFVRHAEDEADFSCQNFVGHKNVKKLQGYNGSADSKPTGKCCADAPPVPVTDALALQPYNAMISRHDDSNCPLLRFVRFDFRDFNFIGTRNSVAFCDIESFSLTDAA